VAATLLLCLEFSSSESRPTKIFRLELCLLAPLLTLLCIPASVLLKQDKHAGSIAKVVVGANPRDPAPPDSGSAASTSIFCKWRTQGRGKGGAARARHTLGLRRAQDRGDGQARSGGADTLARSGGADMLAQSGVVPMVSFRLWTAQHERRRQTVLCVTMGSAKARRVGAPLAHLIVITGGGA
jgi:hypothetical protein